MIDERPELICSEEVHAVNLPVTYIPNPEAHTRIERDAAHINWALYELGTIDRAKDRTQRIIDVGGYDGWLSFILRKHGYLVDMVELIRPLADAAWRYATKHGITDYRVMNGTLDIRQVTDYGVVLLFEVLEHVSWMDATAWVRGLLQQPRTVLISLPLQDWRDNPQHRWTPTEEAVDVLGRIGRDYHYAIQAYTNGTPPNYLIRIES